MSFEERLRQSLQARAEDVRPDPGMWSVVQSRIRRGRTFRVALAGVATALAVAGVALAAPGLIDRRIEFEPGGVATQPAVEPTESTATGPVIGVPHRFVATDGSAVKYWGTERRNPPVDELSVGNAQILSVATRPQTDVARLDIAYAEVVGDGTEDRPCAQVTVASFANDDHELPPLEVSPLRWESGECMTSPAFSPDGRHLAALTVAEPGGTWGLYAVDWADGPQHGPEDDAALFALPWNSDDTVDIQDWVWSEQTSTTATGYLVLRRSVADDTELYRLAIERQGDGALGVSGEPVRVASADGATAVGFAAAGDGTAYTLEVWETGPAPSGGVVSWVDDERVGGFTAPDELFSRAESLAAIWMSASSEGVAFGNNAGLAWVAPFPGETDDGPVPVEPLGVRMIDGELVRYAEVPDEAPSAMTQVDVHFGMTGADACVADQTVPREVEGPGVARAALTELLKGPSGRESNEGITSPFTANTASALNDIKIVDGQARVDFDDFSADVGNDSCTKAAILDSLDKTLLQFPTVTSTRYSFDGSVAAFRDWLGRSSDLPPTPPADVVATQKKIYDAALNADWERLDELSEATSCTLSDQQEPCVPYWKQQKRQGNDPLGVMVDLLSGGAAKDPEASVWVYPPEWADPESDYSGPRIGIGEAGVWHYFVLEGG